jgi:hypothetical protein
MSDAFPKKKFYAKTDTDTALFPENLFAMLRALDAAVVATQPLYIGSVDSLCGNYTHNQVLPLPHTTLAPHQSLPPHQSPPRLSSSGLRGISRFCLTQAAMHRVASIS